MKYRVTELIIEKKFHNDIDFYVILCNYHIDKQIAIVPLTQSREAGKVSRTMHFLCLLHVPGFLSVI